MLGTRQQQYARNRNKVDDQVLNIIKIAHFE